MLSLFLSFFLNIHEVSASSTVWPSESYEIVSAFGPRLKASENNRYDFHRGIDISGEEGSDIFAIEDGEVFRVYEEGSSNYPGGGNVVVIEHEYEGNKKIKGTKITRYYSLYMHLDEIDVRQGEEVDAGDMIGEMGSSGDAESTHLHFETRLQTTCSLESQLEGGCTFYGFDPHVNPLMFLDYDNREPLNVEIVSERPLRVRITSKELDFNSIKVVSSEGTREFNLNTRKGFDASSTEALDDNEIRDVEIWPSSFNRTTGEYKIDFIFKGFDDYRSILVTDIFGRRFGRGR